MPARQSPVIHLFFFCFFLASSHFPCFHGQLVKAIQYKSIVKFLQRAPSPSAQLKLSERAADT